MSITDTWFAWRPVRLGPLKNGRWVWLRRVWRNRTDFLNTTVTVYADLHEASRGRR